MAIELAYLPKHVAESIEFNEESIFRLISQLRRHNYEKANYDSNENQTSVNLLKFRWKNLDDKCRDIGYKAIIIKKFNEIFRNKAEICLRWFAKINKLFWSFQEKN